MNLPSVREQDEGHKNKECSNKKIKLEIHTLPVLM